VVVMEFVVLLV